MTLKLVLVRLHVYAPAAEAHALGFQSQALLNARVALKFDFTTRAQHALPRQSEAAPKYFCDLSGRPRKPRGPRDRAVGRDSPARNRTNCPLDPQEHCASGIGSSGASAAALPCHYAIQPEITPCLINGSLRAIQ